MSFVQDDMFFTRDFHQSIVDNQGNFYLMMKKNNRRSKAEEHEFDIFQVKGQGKEPVLRRFNAPMQGKLTYDAFFAFDNLNNSLVGGGFFSNFHHDHLDNETLHHLLKLPI